MRSASIRNAPRRSACLRSARTSLAFVSLAPRRSTVRGGFDGDSLLPVSADGLPVDSPAGRSLEAFVFVGGVEACWVTPCLPAIVRPMAMPMPTAPQPAATASAAVLPPHWPTAATATSGKIAQDQGDLAAANEIRLSLATPPQSPICRDRRTSRALHHKAPYARIF